MNNEEISRELTEFKEMIKKQNKRIRELEDILLSYKPALKEVINYINSSNKEIIFLEELKNHFKCFGKQNYRKELIKILESRGWYDYVVGIGRAKSRFVKIVDDEYKIAVKVFKKTKSNNIIKVSNIVTPKTIKIIEKIFPDRIIISKVHNNISVKKKY